MLAGTKDRVTAAAADVVLAGAASVGTMLAMGVATSPFWATGVVLSGGTVVITGDDPPGWVTAVVLGTTLLVLVGLSGALSPSNRRTFGHRLSNASIVPADAVGTPGHPDLDATPDTVPARWQVALRWLLPLALYVAVGSWSWTAAVVVVVLGWLPAVVGSRRSVYDRVAGVAVAQVTFLHEDGATA